MKFGDYVKYGFLIIFLLLIAPGIFRALKNNYRELLEPKTRVGRLTIEGTICETGTHVDNIKKLMKEPSNKALLITINSVGGSAGASQSLFSSIMELKKLYPKPVFVFAENICASGAYYIACAGDTIITPASTLVGSIGVYIAHPECKELLDEYKVKYNVIKTGTYKAAGSPWMHDSPEQIAMFQSLTDDTYQQFITDVANRRPQLSLENEKKWAQGRIFTGRQGLEIGLIDVLGSPITAESLIKEKLQITGDIEWVDAPKPSKFAAFFESLSAAANNYGTHFNGVGTLQAHG